MFAATYAEQFDGYSGQQLQATGGWSRQRSSNETADPL
jgi:hypothetical protein